jgi:hypothetical protein
MGVMFLRANRRIKDGKEHRYWSIVENRRTAEGRVVQRQVLYLGEINDSQKDSWCKTIEVLEEGHRLPRQVALFPEDPVGSGGEWKSSSAAGAVGTAPSGGNGVPVGWPAGCGIC